MFVISLAFKKNNVILVHCIFRERDKNTVQSYFSIQMPINYSLLKNGIVKLSHILSREFINLFKEGEGKCMSVL